MSGSTQAQLRSLLEEQRQNFIREDTTVLPPAKYLRSSAGASAPPDGGGGPKRLMRPNSTPSSSKKTTGEIVNHRSGGGSLPSLKFENKPPYSSLPSYSSDPVLEGIAWRDEGNPRSIFTSSSQSTAPAASSDKWEGRGQQRSSALSGGNQRPHTAGSTTAGITGGPFGVAPKPPMPSSSARRPLSRDCTERGSSTVTAADSYYSNTNISFPTPASLSESTTATTVASPGETLHNERQLQSTTASNNAIRAGSASPRYQIDAPLAAQEEPSSLLETLHNAIRLFDAYRTLRVGISEEERLALAQFVTAIGGVEATCQLADVIAISGRQQPGGGSDQAQAAGDAALVAIDDPRKNSAHDEAPPSLAAAITATTQSVHPPSAERNLYFDSPSAPSEVRQCPPAQLAESDLQILFDYSSGSETTLNDVEKVFQRLLGRPDAPANLSVWLLDDAKCSGQVSDEDSSSKTLMGWRSPSMSQHPSPESAALLNSALDFWKQSQKATATTAKASSVTESADIATWSSFDVFFASGHWLVFVCREDAKREENDRRDEANEDLMIFERHRHHFDNAAEIVKSSFSSSVWIAIAFDFSNSSSTLIDIPQDTTISEGLRVLAKSVARGAAQQRLAAVHRSLLSSKELQLSAGQHFSELVSLGEEKVVEALLKELHVTTRHRKATFYTLRFRLYEHHDDCDDGGSTMHESQRNDHTVVAYTLRQDHFCNRSVTPRNSADSSSGSTTPSSSVLLSSYVLDRYFLIEDEVPPLVAIRLAKKSAAGRGKGSHASNNEADDEGNEEDGGSRLTPSLRRSRARQVDNELLKLHLASVTDSTGSVFGVVQFESAEEGPHLSDPNNKPSSRLLHVEVRPSLTFTDSQIVTSVVDLLHAFIQPYILARRIAKAKEASSCTATQLECLALLLHEDISDGKTARLAIVQSFQRIITGYSMMVDCVALFSVNPDSRSFEVVYQFASHVQFLVGNRDKQDNSAAAVAENAIPVVDFEPVIPSSHGAEQCPMDGVALAASQSKVPMVSRKPEPALQSSSSQISDVAIPHFSIKTDGLPYEKSFVSMATIDSIVSIPLISHGKCIAVVQLYNAHNEPQGEKTVGITHDDVDELDRLGKNITPWLKSVLTYEFAVQTGNAAMSFARNQTRRHRGSVSRSAVSDDSASASGSRLAAVVKKCARSAALGTLFVDALHLAGLIKVLEVPQDVLATVALPSFDLWAVRDRFPNAKDMVTKMAVVLFERTGLLTDLKISSEKLVTLIVLLREKYRDVPYHNFFHAFDVLQTIYHFLYDGGHVAKRLSKLTQFVILVTALCHDVDHMGLNNSFHLQSDSPLGILSSATGTQSVLEVHHCNITVELLQQPESDIFAQLPHHEESAAYRLLLDAILATDMAKHGEAVKNLKEMQQLVKKNLLTGASSNETVEGTMNADDGDEGFDQDDGSDAITRAQELERLIAITLLKVADISNVTKPFEISLRWGRAVIEEFSNQGDTEKVSGLTVQPLFDREKNANLAKTQLGFIQFVAEPFLSLVVDSLLPELQYSLDTMKANTEEWKRRFTLSEQQK